MVEAEGSTDRTLISQGSAVSWWGFRFSCLAMGLYKGVGAER